ncbi:MAG: lipopolysaccharide biosynthesis protein [Labilithrix sp.]|nr:lipopolysaccharide biosynthesis protein [Labilithrix sp.]
MRKLGANALLYLIPNLLVRGLSFLLTPVYTRHMSVDEYGLVALSNSVAGLVGVLLGFSITSSITRLHHECTDEGQRRTFYGTVTLFTLVVPTAIAALLHLLGSLGAFDGVFRAVPFRPYLALALWTALLNLHSGIPMGMFATREQPARFAVMNIVIALCQTGATVLLVVVWHEGARGALLAGLIAAAVSATMSLAIMRKHIALKISRSLLVQSLAFSLPLVPHVLSNWALSVSDRLILERYVSQADLGRFSLGYMFSLVVTLVVSAITTALSPAVTRQLKANARAPEVPRLGTVAVAAMALTSLGAAALGGDAIRLMSPPSYHEAARVVPWVVLGAFMQGLYMVWSQGTWFSMKTRAIPVVTGVGAAANVGLNMIFVPRHGIMAAAINTAIAYALLALMHGWLAQRLFPIRWEYRRWTLTLLAAVGCFLVSAALPSSLSLGVLITLRLILVGVLFPVLLVALGVFSLDELRRLRRRVA